MSNQQNYYATNSNNDFLAGATEDFVNNNSSNGFGLNNHSQSSNNGIETANGSINLSSTDISTHLPLLAANVAATPHQILGSTPLSQIGCPPMSLEQYSAQLSPSCGDSDDDIDSELESNTDDIGSNYSLHSSSKRQKRGILPKHATSVMRAWLFQHLVVIFEF